MAECEALGVQGADEKPVQIKTMVSREEMSDWKKRASGPLREWFTKIQNTILTMKQDGIGSVRYQVLEVSRQPLFTNITVDIGRPPSWPPRG